LGGAVGPSISEFSYGFAITSELIRSLGGVTAAPVFPSLFAEGRPGGGWDVRLDRPGVPLFLQFKLCEVMTRRNCRESQSLRFNVPCYRMHLRPARSSRQHEMLLDLERSGQDVYYIAPAFHRPDELNAAFLTRSVRRQSFWVKPSDVGPLPDPFEHHVSFELSGRWAFFSEPRILESKRGFDEVATNLEHRLRERGGTELASENLEKLAASITEIARKRHDIEEPLQTESREAVQGVAPLQRIAYYASVFLESQMFVVQESAGEA